MRITLTIDEALFKKAVQLSKIRQKTTIVHAGLEALIARESSRRLAELGSSERRLKPIRRRRAA